MNYIHEKKHLDNLPKDFVFAALVFGSRYVEGDERSRTAPGHGYPAHNEPVVNLITFDSDAEMKKWVGEQVERRETNYKIVRLQNVPISININVSTGQ